MYSSYKPSQTSRNAGKICIINNHEKQMISPTYYEYFDVSARHHMMIIYLVDFYGGKQHVLACTSTRKRSKFRYNSDTLYLNLTSVNLLNYTGKHAYDGPLYDRLLAMMANMLGHSPMHIKYVSFVYDRPIFLVLSSLSYASSPV